MTTSARPTWALAKGDSEQGGVRMFGTSHKFSSRNLASHTQLKLSFVVADECPHVLRLWKKELVVAVALSLTLLLSRIGVVPGAAAKMVRSASVDRRVFVPNILFLLLD